MHHENPIFDSLPYAKRNENQERRPKQLKYELPYGRYRFWMNNPHDEKVLETNFTDEYFAGPWFSLFPVDTRHLFKSLRWLEIGAKNGWFGAKLYSKMRPQVVMAIEASERYSFLVANNALNIPSGNESQRHAHVVPVRTIEEHPGRKTVIRISGDTGYQSLEGDHEIDTPVVDWRDLMREYRYTALKVDMDGYEAELLAHADVQFDRFKCALFKINPEHHRRKTFDKIATKLDNSFPDGVTRTEHPDGSTMFFGHNLKRF